MVFYNSKLVSIRKEKRCSATKLCRLLNISRTTLWQWETARKKPKKEDIYQISSVLNINVTDISDLPSKKSLSTQEIQPSVSAIHRLAGSTTFYRKQRMKNFVDELAHIERELEQAEIIIRGILESLDAIFYVKDSNLKYLVANHNFLKNVSLRPNYDVIGKSDSDFFNINEAKLNSEQDKDVLRSGKHVHKIEQFIPGTRKHKIGLVSKLPIIDKEGDIIGVMGLIVDITERKKNKQLLQIIESNINSMKDCLAITSGSSYLYVNKAIESLLEYPVNKYYEGGRDFVLKNCIHKDDLQKETKAAKDENYLDRDKIRVVTASGKVKWVDVVRSNNEYLGKKCKVIICRDITEAVSHENMRDLLINALNVSKDVFILTSHSYFGVKYFYSKSIEKLIGLNIKEFYDDHHRIGEFIHPEDLSAFRSSFDMKEIIESGKKLPGLIKYRIIDAKGKIKWLESHFFYFMDKNTIHIGCVMRDITENKIENDTLKKAEQKAVFEEKLKIANKLKEENVSSDIILKTTGVDINSK